MRKVRKYESNWGCCYFQSENNILKRFVERHEFTQPPRGQHLTPLPICVKMFRSHYYLGTRQFKYNPNGFRYVYIHILHNTEMLVEQ